MRGTILVGCGVAIALTLSGCFALDPTSSTETPEPTVTVTVTATPTPDPVPTEEPTVDPTEEPTAEPTATPTAAPGRGTVPVKVTLAEYESDLKQLHVSVTMTGISEEGGTCTATATKGSKKATVTQSADYNVNRVECGGLRFDRSDLSSGSWNVKVSYLSKKFSGTSASTTVKVP